MAHAPSRLPVGPPPGNAGTARRVLLAGPDTANGWGGFIDGAIESGMEAAIDAVTLLKDSTA